VLGPLQLIDQRHGVVLERDVALALLVDEKLILTGPIRSGSLPRVKVRRRADDGPVEVPGNVAVNGEGKTVLLRLCLVCFRDAGRVDQLHARCNL
jgi:hypothetical protein